MLRRHLRTLMITYCFIASFESNSDVLRNVLTVLSLMGRIFGDILKKRLSCNGNVLLWHIRGCGWYLRVLGSNRTEGVSVS